MATYSTTDLSAPIADPVATAVAGTVQEAADVASVLTGNASIAAEASLGIALGQAILQITNAANGPKLSAAETQTAWTNVGAALGSALASYNAAK